VSSPTNGAASSVREPPNSQLPSPKTHRLYFRCFRQERPIEGKPCLGEESSHDISRLSVSALARD
jgi:hypothetical protein